MRDLILNCLIFCFIITSCEQNQFSNSIVSYEVNDCNSLQTNFSSYSEAINIIESTKFTLTDNVNTSHSSWIRGATFYSCDENFGYFVIKTDKNVYIHKDLPISIWNNFKNASSLGSYYNNNIKNRYQLNLTN
jgi:hypothetical protein